MVLSASAEKALSMFLVLLVGFFFRNKFQDAATRSGLRTMILTMALPASIFLSILNIRRDFDFVTPPLFALAINLSYLSIVALLSLFWFTEVDIPQKRSLMMIFPSLAPGLTAFPFIDDFIGRDGLAWAAMSDVGNKIFVLFGLYALAVNWGQKVISTMLSGEVQGLSTSKRIRTLAIALLSEPINVSILLGLILVSFGFSQEDLPGLMADSLSIIGGLTTGLILLFVGISFRFNTDEIIAVLSILLARSGIGFLLSAAAIHFLPAAQQEPLLFVVMPQCGCSLWPFLHMIKVEDQLQDTLKNHKELETLNQFGAQITAQLREVSTLYPKLRKVAAPFEDSLKHAAKDTAKLKRVLEQLEEKLKTIGQDYPKVMTLGMEIATTLKKLGKDAPNGRPLVFNTDYAMSLLAVSFPFSIGVVLFIFADPDPFQSSLDLTFIGMVFLMMHFIFKQATKGHSPVRTVTAPPPSGDPPESAPEPPVPAERPKSAPLTGLSPEFQGLSVNEISRRLLSGHRLRSR